MNSWGLAICKVHLTSASRWLPSNSLIFSPIRLTSESNYWAANAGTCKPVFAMTKAPVSPRISCNCIWARAVAAQPPAPIMVADLRISVMFLCQKRDYTVLTKKRR